MSRIRLILLSGLAVVALSAVATASASAAAQYWVGGAAFSGEETVSTNAVTPFKLKSKLSTSAEVVIECSTVTSTGAKLFSNNLGSATKVSFTGCKVNTPSACKVKEPIETVGVNTTLEDVGTTEVGLKFAPATGKKFTSITITGCAGEGIYEVKETARCLETAPATESAKKECVFSTTSGSNLKFGTNTAELTGTAGFELSGAKAKTAWTGKF